MFTSKDLNPQLGDRKNSLISKLLFTATLLIVMLTANGVASAQYKEVKRLGTSQAICPKPGVQSIVELQEFFSKNQSLVQSILDDASWQGNAQQLFDAVAQGDVTERQFAPGTTFEWMGMRDKGVAKAQPQRVWAGDADLDAFQVSLTSACKTYQIVIPKICCNVSLASIATVTDTPALSITATQRVLQVCSESDASVSLKTPGQTQPLLLDEQFCWKSEDMDAGFYTAVASTDCGSTERSIEIQTDASTVEPVTKPFGIVPFIAPFFGSETIMRFETAWQTDMRDTSGVVGVRVGMKIPLSKTLSLVPALGLMHRNGINNGNEYPDETMSLDFGIEKSLARRFFVGAGVGLWNVDDSDFREPSVFLNTGGAITTKIEWFAELRGIDSDNEDGKDGFSDNRFYGAGVRFKF